MSKASKIVKGSVEKVFTVAGVTGTYNEFLTAAVNSETALDTQEAKTSLSVGALAAVINQMYPDKVQLKSGKLVHWFDVQKGDANENTTGCAIGAKVYKVKQDYTQALILAKADFYNAKETDEAKASKANAANAAAKLKKLCDAARQIVSGARNEAGTVIKAEKGSARNGSKPVRVLVSESIGQAIKRLKGAKDKAASDNAVLSYLEQALRTLESGIK